MKWKPGESGNPAGRKTHPLAERFRKVDEPQLGAVIQSMIDAAIGGDVQAARLLIERIVPALKPVAHPAGFQLEGDTLTEKAESIISAAAAGSIAVPDAKQLIDALALLAKITEFDELERRIAALEDHRNESR